MPALPLELRSGDVFVDGVRISTHASRGPQEAPLPAGVRLERATDFGSQLVIDREGSRITVLTGALEAPCVPCDVLALDTTYALPVFRWPDAESVRDELRAWVQLNADAGRAALLAADPSDEGKRILALLGPNAPVLVNPEPSKSLAKEARGKLVLVAPPELREPRLKLGPHETALASGKMRVRGNRRRLAVDRGFVLSSRADWPTLLRAVDESGATQLVTFGAQADHFARWLRDQGRDARELAP